MSKWDFIQDIVNNRSRKLHDRFIDKLKSGEISDNGAYVGPRESFPLAAEENNNLSDYIDNELSDKYNTYRYNKDQSGREDNLLDSIIEKLANPVKERQNRKLNDYSFNEDDELYEYRGQYDTPHDYKYDPFLQEDFLQRNNLKRRIDSGEISEEEANALQEEINNKRNLHRIIDSDKIDEINNEGVKYDTFPTSVEEEIKDYINEMIYNIKNKILPKKENDLGPKKFKDSISLDDIIKKQNNNNDDDIPF